MTGLVVRLRWRLWSRLVQRNVGLLISTILGVVVGLGLAAGAVGALVVIGLAAPQLRGVAVIALALATLSWTVLSVLAAAADSTVDPARFAVLPVRPRPLAVGLFVAVLTGIPPVLLLVVALSTVVTWSDSPATAAAALGSAVLGVLLTVLLARVVVGLLAGVMAGRRGRAVGASLISLVALTPAALGLALGTAASAQPAAAPLPSVWDLKPIFASDADWDGARKALVAELPQLQALQGTLGKSPATFRAGLERLTRAAQAWEKVQVYAYLQQSTDNRNASYQERGNLVAALGGQYAAATAWLEPEIQKLGAAKVQGFLKAEPSLKPYAERLRNILRRQPHTLSAETEAAIAALAPVRAATAQVRTLLVDADMRNPSVHRALAMPKDRGLSNFLSGHSEGGTLTRDTAIEGLSVITAGPMPPDPVELLAGPKFAMLLDKAHELGFEHIIVDGPPMLGIADALVLGNQIQHIVFVVKAASTRRTSVKDSLRRMRMAGLAPMGMVLTHAKDEHTPEYAYESYYGYEGRGGKDGPAAAG